jgi:hypothetical protein
MKESGLMDVTIHYKTNTIQVRPEIIHKLIIF